MWRLTLLFNPVLMFLSWGLSTSLISMADNRFVEYPSSDKDISLPGLTALIFSLHPYYVILPLAWTALSVVIYRYVHKKPIEIRNEFLLFFSIVTISICAFIVLVYSIAGTLPFLLIGTQID